MMLKPRTRGERQKYGPPVVRPRAYPMMLELLETQANHKLAMEYVQDIRQTLSALETTSSVNTAMIDLQPEIQWFMRPFLLDFLIELHGSFKLHPQTLFLCLNIVDRYCAKRIVFKRHYQLVGCTALWIAGKYEDKKSRVPTLRELAIMCRNAYDEEMFVQMEMHILATLEWSLSHPNLEECLQLAITSSKLNSVTPCKYNVTIEDKSFGRNSSNVTAVTAIGRFLCELSLYDKFFLSVPSSLVSITANLLACSMLQLPHASISLQELIEKHLNSSTQENSDFNDYDENSENQRPEVSGAFLSGFDDLAIYNIRKIALMFILQLSKATSVLTKKYEELGVIQVVKNFSNRHSAATTAIYENSNIVIEMTPVQLSNSKLSNIADTLLQLQRQDVCYMEAPQQPPLTPPSATSQYSVFSNKRSFIGTPGDHSFSQGSESISEYSPADCSRNSSWTSPLSVHKMHV